MFSAFLWGQIKCGAQQMWMEAKITQFLRLVPRHQNSLRPSAFKAIKSCCSGIFEEFEIQLTTTKRTGKEEEEEKKKEKEVK